MTLGTAHLNGFAQCRRRGGGGGFRPKVAVFQGVRSRNPLTGIPREQLFQKSQSGRRYLAGVFGPELAWWFVSPREGEDFCRLAFFHTRLEIVVGLFRGRCTEHFENQVELIQFRLARKEGLAENKFGQNAACTPDIDGRPVVDAAQ